MLAACPPLTVLVEHVRAFADLLTTRRGANLEAWMTAGEASDLPALHAFVRGLRKDLDAVVAGLSLPYSNGPIEGTNTKFNPTSPRNPESCQDELRFRDLKGSSILAGQRSFDSTRR